MIRSGMSLRRGNDLSVLEGVPGVTFSDDVVEVGPNLMTGHLGIFAGGDMVPSERTVTVAIGHRKEAARSIDAFPRGTGSRTAGKHAPVSFGALNTLVRRVRPGHRTARAGGGPADLHLRRGDRRAGLLDHAVRSAGAIEMQPEPS
jgi:hypothetical protein